MSCVEVILNIQLTNRLRILSQPHSWDYLSASLEVLRKILWFYDVFPLFLDILHAFGSKSVETDENFSGSSFQTLQTSNSVSYGHTP